MGLKRRRGGDTDGREEIHIATIGAGQTGVWGLGFALQRRSAAAAITIVVVVIVIIIAVAIVQRRARRAIAIVQRRARRAIGYFVRDHG